MKKQIAIAITIALVAITRILTTSVLSEEVNKPNRIISAFDQNPAESDGNEWIAFYNPTNDTIDLCNWKLTTKHGGGKTVTLSEEAKLIPEGEGTEIAPQGYRFVTCSTGFLRNENESVTLIDPSGNGIDFEVSWRKTRRELGL